MVVYKMSRWFPECKNYLSTAMFSSISDDVVRVPEPYLIDDHKNFRTIMEERVDVHSHGIWNAVLEEEERKYLRSHFPLEEPVDTSSATFAENILRRCPNIVNIHKYFSNFEARKCCLTVTGGTVKSLKLIRYEESSLQRWAAPELRTTTFQFVKADGSVLSENDFETFRRALLCARFPILSAPTAELDSSPAPSDPDSDARGVLLRAMRPRSAGLQRGERKHVGSGDDEEQTELTSLLELSGSFTSREAETQEQTIAVVPPETLCYWLRCAFGLNELTFRAYTRKTYEEYRKKSEAKILVNELCQQLSLLENDAHPFYNQHTFGTRQAYLQWQQRQRALIGQLLDKVWQRSLPPLRRRTAVSGLHQVACHHTCYTQLFTRLAGYEAEVRGPGGAGQPLITLSSASKRLLHEYALRYSIGEVYQVLVLLKTLADNLGCEAGTVRQTVECLQRLRSLSPINQARFVMVIQEYKEILTVLESIHEQCKQALSRVQRTFPENQAVAGVKMMLELLREVICTKEWLSFCSVGSSPRLTDSIRSPLSAQFRSESADWTSSDKSSPAPRPSVDSLVTDCLSEYCRANVEAEYNRFKVLAQNEIDCDRRFSIMSAKLMTRLILYARDEVAFCQQNFASVYERYVDVTQLTAKVLYTQLLEDCRSLSHHYDAHLDWRGIDLSVLSVAYRLDELDQAWAAWIPLHRQEWRLVFFRHSQHWISVLRQHSTRFILHSIAADDFYPVIFEGVSKEGSETDTRDTSPGADQSRPTSTRSHVSLSASQYSAFSSVPRVSKNEERTENTTTFYARNEPRNGARNMPAGNQQGTVDMLTSIEQYHSAAEALQMSVDVDKITIVDDTLHEDMHKEYSESSIEKHPDRTVTRSSMQEEATGIDAQRDEDSVVPSLAADNQTDKTSTKTISHFIEQEEDHVVPLQVEEKTTPLVEHKVSNKETIKDAKAQQPEVQSSIGKPTPLRRCSSLTLTHSGTSPIRSDSSCPDLFSASVSDSNEFFQASSTSIESKGDQKRSYTNKTQPEEADGGSTKEDVSENRGGFSGDLHSQISRDSSSDTKETRTVSSVDDQVESDSDSEPGFVESRSRHIFPNIEVASHGWQSASDEFHLESSVEVSGRQSGRGKSVQNSIEMSFGDKNVYNFSRELPTVSGCQGPVAESSFLDIYGHKQRIKNDETSRINTKPKLKAKRLFSVVRPQSISISRNTQNTGSSDQHSNSEHKVAKSFVEWMCLANRLIHTFRCFSSAVFPISTPQNGTVQKESDFLKELLYLRHKLQTDMEDVLLECVTTYRCNLLSMDMCGEKARVTTFLAGTQWKLHLLKITASALQAIMDEVQALFDAEKIWGCRHMKRNSPCSEYLNKRAPCLRQKFEPISKQMCCRISSLVNLERQLYDVEMCCRISSLVNLERHLYDVEVHLCQSLAIQRMLHTARNVDLHLTGNTSAMFAESRKRVQESWRILNRFLAYRLNNHVREMMFKLLRLDQPPYLTARKRYAPLIGLLRTHAQTLNKWMPSEAFTVVIENIWIYFIKDVEELIKKLICENEMYMALAENMVQLVVLLMVVLTASEMGLDADYAYNHMTRCLEMLHLCSMPTHQLAVTYRNMVSYQREKRQGPAKDQPSWKYIERMCDDLHRHRKYFSGLDLLDWIMLHSRESREEYVSSDPQTSPHSTDGEQTPVPFEASPRISRRGHLSRTDSLPQRPLDDWERRPRDHSVGSEEAFQIAQFLLDQHIIKPLEVQQFSCSSTEELPTYGGGFPDLVCLSAPSLSYQHSSASLAALQLQGRVLTSSHEPYENEEEPEFGWKTPLSGNASLSNVPSPHLSLSGRVDSGDEVARTLTGGAQASRSQHNGSGKYSGSGNYSGSGKSRALSVEDVHSGSGDRCLTSAVFEPSTSQLYCFVRIMDHVEDPTDAATGTLPTTPLCVPVCRRVKPHFVLAILHNRRYRDPRSNAFLQSLPQETLLECLTLFNSDRPANRCFSFL